MMLIELRMFFLDQMKLLGLISVISILASSGQCWNITVPRRHINATLDSTEVIQCNFSYPQKYRTDNIQVLWKFFGTSINISDVDKNPLVYHPNATYIHHMYRGRTKLIGDIKNGNCSLEIRNIKANESRMYMRLRTGKEDYSFKLYDVSISVSGSGVAPVTNDPDPLVDHTTGKPTSVSTTTQADKSHIYVTISVPVSILVVIILTAGCLCYIKCKKSQSFTREESGYYANFSRASSNQAQREISSTNQENKKLSEAKITDEPVYVNTEALTGQMDQSSDHIDSVYANVDYTK